MDVLGIKWGYVLVMLFNLLLLGGWLVLAIFALFRLRHLELTETARAIWAALILLIPIGGRSLSGLSSPAGSFREVKEGMKLTINDKRYLCLTTWFAMGVLFICSACQPAPAASPEPMDVSTPRLIPSPEPDPTGDCSVVERLPNDSGEAQQILEEFIRNFKKERPTEYMGMAILDRVDRLGEWAVVQGSVSGDDGNILIVHQTSRGYQLVEDYFLTPAFAAEEPEERVTQHFLEKLPDAPRALFTCLEGTWFPGREARPTEPPHAYQLVYLGTDNGNTDGVTEIHVISFDGSEPRLVLSAPMMVIDLVLSPDGEQFAFWGRPGAIAYDCVPPEEDLDVWAVNWDGSILRNLTEGSAANDAHPSWSPDGEQIVFDSDRSGIPELFIMNADGGGPRAITDDSLRNTEPKWSPDGKWIAYHCSQGIDNRICVVSPDGEPAGEPTAGTGPVWSPPNLEGGLRLAFHCFEGTQSDICTVRPDGSDLVNLTKDPSDEHSPAWSPDGNWLAFVSNQGEDVDVYKVCVTCSGDFTVIRLTDEPGPAGSPAWSADGNWVAYWDWIGQTLMMVKADRSDRMYLASGAFGPPIWKP